MDDLSAASVEDVASFFKTYYAPNNAVLAIVGDVKAADAWQGFASTSSRFHRNHHQPPWT